MAVRRPPGAAARCPRLWVRNINLLEHSLPCLNDPQISPCVYFYTLLQSQDLCECWHSVWGGREGWPAPLPTPCPSHVAPLSLSWNPELPLAYQIIRGHPSCEPCK